jgi:hypothetical protein
MRILPWLIDLLKRRRRSTAALKPTATLNLAGPRERNQDGAAEHSRQVVTQLTALTIHTT